MNIFREFSERKGRIFSFLKRKGISIESLYISSCIFQFALGILCKNTSVSH